MTVSGFIRPMCHRQFVAKDTLFLVCSCILPCEMIECEACNEWKIPVFLTKTVGEDEFLTKKLYICQKSNGNDFSLLLRLK